MKMSTGKWIGWKDNVFIDRLHDDVAMVTCVCGEELWLRPLASFSSIKEHKCWKCGRRFKTTLKVDVEYYLEYLNDR